MRTILWITTGVLALASSAPADELSRLDRGHRLLIKHGLQIQAQVFHSPLARLDLDWWRRSNFTTVNLHKRAPRVIVGLSGRSQLHPEDARPCAGRPLGPLDLQPAARRPH